MTDTRFRTLLCIYAALVAMSIACVFFPTHSESLAVALENEPQGWFMSHFWVAVGTLVALAIAWVAGCVGLFFFKAWARLLSLGATIAGVLVYPFTGATLTSGLEGALLEASSMVWGAILALSYFSSVSGRFGR